MSPAKGIVVAVHGKGIDAGDFMVEDILESGLPPQIKWPLNSGLSVGSNSANPLHFQLWTSRI
ncbi:DNA polymerase delta subunit 2 [Orobanche minor]